MNLLRRIRLVLDPSLAKTSSSLRSLSALGAVALLATAFSFVYSVSTQAAVALPKTLQDEDAQDKKVKIELQAIHNKLMDVLHKHDRESKDGQAEKLHAILRHSLHQHPEQNKKAHAVLDLLHQEHGAVDSSAEGVLGLLLRDDAAKSDAEAILVNLAELQDEGNGEVSRNDIAAKLRALADQLDKSHKAKKKDVLLNVQTKPHVVLDRVLDPRHNKLHAGRVLKLEGKPHLIVDEAHPEHKVKLHAQDVVKVKAKPHIVIHQDPKHDQIHAIDVQVVKPSHEHVKKHKVVEHSGDHNVDVFVVESAEHADAHVDFTVEAHASHSQDSDDDDVSNAISKLKKELQQLRNEIKQLKGESSRQTKDRKENPQATKGDSKQDLWVEVEFDGAKAKWHKAESDKPHAVFSKDGNIWIQQSPDKLKGKLQKLDTDKNEDVFVELIAPDDIKLKSDTNIIRYKYVPRLDSKEKVLRYELRVVNPDEKKLLHVKPNLKFDYEFKKDDSDDVSPSDKRRTTDKEKADDRLVGEKNKQTVTDVRFEFKDDQETLKTSKGTVELLFRDKDSTESKKKRRPKQEK